MVLYNYRTEVVIYQLMRVPTYGYTYTYNLNWTSTYGSHINIWIIPPSGTELGLPQMRGWARALRTSASGSALIMGSFVSQNPHHIWPPTYVVRDGGCSSPKVYAKVYTEDMEESDKSHASCSGETYMSVFFPKGVEHFFTENGSTMEG